MSKGIHWVKCAVCQCADDTRWPKPATDWEFCMCGHFKFHCREAQFCARSTTWVKKHNVEVTTGVKAPKRKAKPKRPKGTLTMDAAYYREQGMNEAASEALDIAERKRLKHGQGNMLIGQEERKRLADENWDGGGYHGKF